MSVTTADLWRELDLVRVNAPHVGLNEADVQVLEYTLTEGSTEMETNCMFASGSLRCSCTIFAVSSGHTLRHWVKMKFATHGWPPSEAFERCAPR